MFNVLLSIFMRGVASGAFLSTVIAVCAFSFTWVMELSLFGTATPVWGVFNLIWMFAVLNGLYHVVEAVLTYKTKTEPVEV